MAKVINVPHFGEIINERPEGMVFEKYKEIVRLQKKRIRERLKGVFVWKSRGMLSTDRAGRIIPVENWGTAVRKDIPIIKLA